ncbi:hypothetical protein GGR92_002975 [Spirosoma lacussanchae]|uniref:hypothetical protein n=1 Tax=Spirosoma lacussanchae TaxID=1884249 RepID=UPI001108A1D5|nr:hypothetical protein [Spirosoma lacussanchae]
MRAFFFFLLISLALAACVDTDTSVTSADPDWLRLEIPSGGEARQVAGGLDSTLFVATTLEIYKTSNRGKSWELIRRRHHGPQGIILRQDTLWNVTNRGGPPQQTFVYDRYADYTVDGGKTWQKDKNPTELRLQINAASATNGTVYTIRENSTPKTEDPSSAYVNPAGILRQTAGQTTLLALPFRHGINALHLDSKSRLYVAVYGTHIPETNRILSSPTESPAVIYLSRRPQP